jgi:hypothetical protein
MTFPLNCAARNATQRRHRPVIPPSKDRNFDRYNKNQQTTTSNHTPQLLLLITQFPHFTQLSPSRRKRILQFQNLNLLLHLLRLELVATQLGVIVGSLATITLSNDILYLSDQTSASCSHCSARPFKSFLRLGHERSLHARRGDELSSRCSNIIRSDDELFVGGSARDDSVGRFDKSVRRGRHGFGG